MEPLYRAPGNRRWIRISWADAVDILARRLKDLRDRENTILPPRKEPLTNRFDSVGVVAGGCLTNEEAYTAAKLFKSLGVGQLDTTVRSSHGAGVIGLMETLGLPGATHPVTQVAFSDVVVLAGCNPGQTAPAVSRFLDEVRRRRGVVIVLDPRRSETIRNDDIFLRVRPGTDGVILGAFIHHILEYGDVRKPDLMAYSDAALLVLGELMGEYEEHRSGKYKNQLVVDETFTEPYSIFQRMRKHFQRYDLRKAAKISGVDIDLLRRACTLIARTTDPHFSASFLLGSGALGHHMGTQVVRMAAMAQALLGNLDKKGGGIVLPAAAGNAQGTCDMGLLAPFFPGYLDLSDDAPRGRDESEKAAVKALCRVWFPRVDPVKSVHFLPRRKKDEFPSLSTIFQGVDRGSMKGLIVAGADPLGSHPDSRSLAGALPNLNLLVVMNPYPNRTSEFWKVAHLPDEAVKTEVLFIPTELPIRKRGTMTDSGRRVRTIHPLPPQGAQGPGMLDFLLKLGNSIRSKYLAEGGALSEPILEMNWPLTQVPEDVAAEINGWRKNGPADEVPLTQTDPLKTGDRCGNRLYRGWITGEGPLADRRNSGDPYGTGLFDRWGWFWPKGIPDPFSWVRVKEGKEGVFLRWGEQGVSRKTVDILPNGRALPVRFWSKVGVGSPFPEHYEPFSSPLHDKLTGGLPNPYLIPRTEKEKDWGFLTRTRSDILKSFPLIVSVHRTGNTEGTGGGTILNSYLRELGCRRIVEISPLLAAEMKIETRDQVLVFSPFREEGVTAMALVTGRVGVFGEDEKGNHVISLTLFGEEMPGLNSLTSPVFDSHTGGLEIKTFMGRIEKVESDKKKVERGKSMKV